MVRPCTKYKVSVINELTENVEINYLLTLEVSGWDKGNQIAEIIPKYFEGTPFKNKNDSLSATIQSTEKVLLNYKATIWLNWTQLPIPECR